MSIPTDLKKRWWIDVSAENPALVNSFSPTLVAFLAFDQNREPKLVGSGFIVAVDQHFALVISAKHVFAEGVLKAQRPYPRHAPSAVLVGKRDRTPVLDASKLKVLWGGSKNAAMFNAVYMHYSESLDLACCIVEPQLHESIPEQLFIPLDVNIPSVGEVVHMVSNDGLKSCETASPRSNIDGTGQRMKLSRRVSIRIGVVTGVHLQGYRQYKWPCFTTSIPAEAGMSGGFVYRPIEGETIAASGIVCADNSPDKARNDFFHCGESVIGCAWPALGLRMPSATPQPGDSPQTHTLLEMMRRGNIPLPHGGIERINTKDSGNGDCIISMEI